MTDLCPICNKPIYPSFQRRVLEMGYYDSEVTEYHYDCLHSKYPTIGVFNTE